MAAIRPTPDYLLQAPGLFANLTAGHVHYAIRGLESGGHVSPASPLIVCIHGISAEMTIWNKFVTYFTAKGRVLLTLDLFGRGYSDASPRDNNLDLFLEQVRELLDHPDVKAKVSTDTIDIVGSSLGGGISAAFTARFPSRVRRSVLMAPAGLGLPTFGSVLQALFRFPWIGRTLLSVANLRGLEKNMLNSFGNPTDPEVVAFVSVSAKRATDIASGHPGYVSSFVSTVGHFPLNTMQADFAALAQRSKAVLAVWGDRDTVVSYERDAPSFRQLAQGVEVFVLEGGGHIDHFVIQRYADQLHARVGAFLA